MSWEAASAIATAILAGATVVLAVGVPIGLRQTNKTLQRERYAFYVRRYEEIMTNLPYNIFVKGNEVSGVDEKQKAWLVAYVDLCEEELYNRQKKAIDEKVWRDWAESIVANFNNSYPLCRLFEEVKSNYPRLETFVRPKHTCFSEAKK